MNVEQALTDEIPAIGGVHVRSIVGDSPGFENADFLFRNAGVVAELKCLDQDKMFDEAIILAATDLYIKERATDSKPPIAFGEVALTTKGFSESFTRRIAALYEKPIKRLVEKANRQIRDTVAELKLAQATGMLIVANNRHSALDPWHAHHIFQRVLERQTYSSINSLVYVSAGQQISLPGSHTPVDVCFEVCRRNIPPVDSQFVAEFRQVWFRCLSRERGQSEYREMPIGFEAFTNLENKKET